MVVVYTKSDLRRRITSAKKSGKKIGFVPTMGALHDGHLQLIKACVAANDFSVVSIFVNPIQFGPGEDYQRYPRNLNNDLRLLKDTGVDIVFAPKVKEVYPQGYRTFVQVEGLSEKLCGKYRPGHFRGVATVVLKLFNLVQPDQAYFGWKDAQQLIIVRKMVKDLDLPVKIIGLPTVREPDGLAMSSRNRYLSGAERSQALILYRSLQQIKEAVEKKEKDLKEAIAQVRSSLKKNRFVKLQYLEAVDLSTLESVENSSAVTFKKVLVAIAAFVGSTRLIDNVILKIPSSRNKKAAHKDGKG